MHAHHLLTRNAVYISKRTLTASMRKHVFRLIKNNHIVDIVIMRDRDLYLSSLFIKTTYCTNSEIASNIVISVRR